MVPILLAITGAPWESEFVGRLGGAGPRTDRVDLVVVRRCVDVADLLATASTGVARAAVVWPGLHRLDGAVIADLSGSGIAVVGVVGAGEDEGNRLGLEGMAGVVSCGAPLDRLAAVTAEAVERFAADGGPPGRAVPTGTAHVTGGSIDAGGSGDARANGSLIAVWGATGAPGRTTIAVSLADELARLGTPTVLADADVYGGAVAEALGIIDEAPGLAAAVRLATAGTVSPSTLAGVARQVAPKLRVLTGLPRADRWPELRPRALGDVWEACRGLAAVTIVDCGFCLEQDEEISFDVSAPRRNGATLATLAAADTVCAVVSAEPVGIVRFVRTVDAVRAAAPSAALHVVVNRVRKGPIGRAPERQLTEVIEGHAGVRPAAFIPHDRAAFDAAVRNGQLLADVAPGSPARVALQALARSLIGLPHETRDRRRRQSRPAKLAAR